MSDSICSISLKCGAGSHIHALQMLSKLGQVVKLSQSSHILKLVTWYRLLHISVGIVTMVTIPTAGFRKRHRDLFYFLSDEYKKINPVSHQEKKIEGKLYINIRIYIYYLFTYTI